MSEKEREIFIHNHKPLINFLVQQGFDKLNGSDKLINDLNFFLRENEGQFIVKLGKLYKTPTNYLKFKDVEKKHTPTLQLQAFAKVLIKQIELKKQLFYAVKKGDSNLVIELIKKGADPNATIIPALYKDIGIVYNFRGIVPLHIAVINGDEETVRTLIENGANINAPTHRLSGKRTASSHAVETGNLEMVKFLFKRGADRSIRIADRPIGGGCISRSSGYTLLHCATAMENLAMVEFLSKYDPDIDVQVKGDTLDQKGIIDAHDYTSLHIAIAKGNLEIVKFFLEHEADTTIKGGRYRYTPLELATQKGNLDIVNLFRDHEATKSKIDNPNAAQPQGAAQAL